MSSLGFFSAEGYFYNLLKDNLAGFNDNTFCKLFEVSISRVENYFTCFAKLMKFFANSDKSFAVFCNSYSYVKFLKVSNLF